MNTNRDASQRTKYNNAKTLSRYYQSRVNSINAGNLLVAPGTYSDVSSKTHIDFAIAKTECCIPTSSISISAGPTYQTYYVTFTTTGSTTWTAPATCQSPITYWIVGGGGGGGGAFDNAGGGGGGGGAATTGTYAVVGGTTYSIVVGGGGAGGTAIGSTYPNPAVTPGTCTNGTVGTSSSFDSVNGGPSAAGGGAGLKRGNNTHAGGGDGGLISIGGYGGDGGYGGGGGGGAGGNGTNAGALSAGTGGTGISFTIPGYNGGNSQSYGIGGNGAANINTNFSFNVGADGSANTGKGGGGGGAGSYGPPYAGGVIKLGGNGGSGLVVIQYSA